jgi:acetoin utilization protein AcuB
VEISRVMSSPPVTVGAEVPVEQAARILADRKIGCLPVIDRDGRLVGLVTETDVLRYFAARTGPDLSH